MDVIRKDANWRIGKGDQVRVWGDPWLANVVNHKVQTLPPRALQEALVCSLMKSTKRSWDEDFLQDIFDPQDSDLAAKYH